MSDHECNLISHPILQNREVVPGLEDEVLFRRVCHGEVEHALVKAIDWDYVRKEDANVWHVFQEVNGMTLIIPFEERKLLDKPNPTLRLLTERGDVHDTRRIRFRDLPGTALAADQN